MSLQPIGGSAPPSPIRLYLSGGSHRSALASAGAIVFLALNNDPNAYYRWRNVTEIVGVSGGSITIAALLSNHVSEFKKPGDDEAHTIETLRRFVHAVHSDKAQPSVPGRSRFVIAALILITLPMIALIALAGTTENNAVVLFIGLVMLGVIYWCMRKLGAAYLRHYLSAVLRATGPKAAAPAKNLAVAQSNVRDYFIGAVGLVSGSNAFLHATGPRDETSPVQTSAEPASDQGMLELSPIEAALASSSLPPLTPVARPRTPTSTTVNEPLMDGGFAGNFGLQISNDLLADLGNPTVQHSGLDVIALDAGRFIDSQKALSSAVTDLSTVARLSRSIQVASDATYQNDIQDLLDIKDDINANSASLVVARTSTSPSATIATALGPTKIELLQKLTAHIDLFSLFNPPDELKDHDPTWIAFLAGVVAMFIAEADAKQGAYDIPVLEKTLKVIGAAMNTKEPDFLHTLWRNVK